MAGDGTGICILADPEPEGRESELALFSDPSEALEPVEREPEPSLSSRGRASPVVVSKTSSSSAVILVGDESTACVSAEVASIRRGVGSDRFLLRGGVRVDSSDRAEPSDWTLCGMEARDWGGSESALGFLPSPDGRMAW